MSIYNKKAHGLSSRVMTGLIIPIVGPDFAACFRQVRLAENLADMLEYRVDLWDDEARRQWQSLHPKCSTLVTKNGHAVDIQGDYEDVRYGKDLISGPSFLSYHHQLGSPLNLSQLLDEMLASSADFIKIALEGSRQWDAFSIVKKRQEGRIVLVGETFLRALATHMGCPWTFACLDGESRVHPGQCLAREWRALYGKTGLIFGLAGDPVARSIGHLYHGRGLGTYVKWQVPVADLPSFVRWVRREKVAGVSVTTPLKEAICAHLDQLSPEARACGAVNTLYWDEDRLVGDNTDGEGAVRILGDVVGRRTLLVGAGSVAAAITQSLKGALITQISRSAGTLGQLKACLEQPWDVLIHATTVGFGGRGNLFEDCDLSRVKKVLDVVHRPRWTPLLLQARASGCQIISGMEMFFAQADAQRALWKRTEACAGL